MKKNNLTRKIRVIVLLAIWLATFDNSIGQKNGFSINIAEPTSALFTLDDGESIINSQFKLSKFPVGHPDIIAMSALMIIPNGTEAEVNVNAGNYKVYSENYVKPVPPPIMEGDDEETPNENEYKNNTIYNSSQMHPGKFYEIKKLGKVRGLELAILYVYPFQYDPQKEITYLYNDINLDITYKGDIEKLPANLLSEYKLKPFKHDPIETKVINYDQIMNLALQEPNNLKSATTYEPGCEFLIITNDLLAPAAERLKTIRESEGIKTHIKAFSGEITPEDIDTYIEKCYAKMEPVPRYVMLLGDVDILPASDELPGKTTDLPYFDIEDEAPRLPDFSSGRMPVSTLEDANNWLDKIITYESISPNDLFFDDAALVSFFKPIEPNCGVERCRYIKTSEELGTLFTFKKFNFDRLYYSDQNKISHYTYLQAFMMSNDQIKAPIPKNICLPNENGFVWNKKNSAVINSINDYKFLVIHRGHGSTSAWGGKNFLQFEASDIDKLTNKEFPSVVWSLNCLTGKFDGDEDCISEKLVKHKNGGAVGVIAATEETETIYNDYLAHGLAKAVWKEFDELLSGQEITQTGYGSLRMGDILRSGLLDMININNHETQISPNVINHLCSYHLLGDPTMELYLPFTSCTPSLNIEEHIVDSGQHFGRGKAKEIIVKSGFKVNKGGTVQLSAGDRIVFNKGVRFEKGSKLQAYLDICNEPEPELKNSNNQRQFIEKEYLNSEENKPRVPGLKIYPNPANKVIYIECTPEHNEATILIYNYSGKLITNLQSTSQKQPVNISNYQPGIYFIKTLTKESVSTGSFVVY